ncbi:YheC/YheD family protein [Paenibacillus sp. N4]|nr:YheC/YheD family protein [Paenibacillus vietnamensis]
MGKPAAQAAGKRRIADKWSKTLVLLRDEKVRGYVPLTKMLTKDSLSSMLQLYGMVYVKPTRGSLGRGVIKAELLSQGGKGASKRSYAYQLGRNRRKFESYDAFYRSLMKDTQGENYLVQKGIHLLKYKGLPFDIRLMVQRKPQGGWEATGTVGRVAHPGKIVTNGSQGGSIYPTAYLLKPYASPKARRELLGRMDRIGIDTVKRLYSAYPGIVEIGLDLALDRNLKPWILEVNTVPDPCPFSLLPDQTMLRRIVRYGKAYGRTYRLNCTKAKRGLQR